MQETRASESVLVIVATPHLEADELRLVRELVSRGAKLVAWQHPPIVQERFPSPDVNAALAEADLPSIPLAKALGEAANVEVDDAVIDWMKAFGRSPLGPGGGFRSLFRYRQLSLWWWAELFLYHDTPLRLFVRDVEAMARLLEKERPRRVVVIGPTRDLGKIAAKLTGNVETYGKPLAGPVRPGNTSIHFASALIKMMGTSLKALFRSPRKSVAASQSAPRRLLFVTHASMWKEQTDEGFAEMYLDPILKALGSNGEEVKVVAVGPQVPFRQRSLGDRLRDVLELEDRRRPYVAIRRYFSFTLGLSLTGASLSCWRMWRSLRRQPLLEEALKHRGVPLPRVSLTAFRDTFLLQLPWAIRSYREIEATLLRERPHALVLYAEYSGLGRAAVAAACSQKIPTFAVQHGILYPRLYASEHAADEMDVRQDGVDSVPIPTKTAVFGNLARQLLIERGKYPPERIVITGSPKFDALVEAGHRFNKLETRRRLGLSDDAPMVVVASRFVALGSAFADLVRAAEAIDNLWLVVKPHQAERPDPYQGIGVRVGASRLLVVPPEENLLELLFASDALITVDSLASSEALVLGRPVLVVNLPSNLSALVERGVAVGVRRGEPMEPQLRRLLFDRELGQELEARRKKYIEEFAFGADGSSTARIVDAIREASDEGERTRARSSP